MASPRMTRSRARQLEQELNDGYIAKKPKIVADVKPARRRQAAIENVVAQNGAKPTGKPAVPTKNAPPKDIAPLKTVTNVIQIKAKVEVPAPKPRVLKKHVVRNIEPEYGVGDGAAAIVNRMVNPPVQNIPPFRAINVRAAPLPAAALIDKAKPVAVKSWKVQENVNGVPRVVIRLKEPIAVNPLPNEQNIQRIIGAAPAPQLVKHPGITAAAAKAERNALNANMMKLGAPLVVNRPAGAQNIQQAGAIAVDHRMPGIQKLVADLDRYMNGMNGINGLVGPRRPAAAATTAAIATSPTALQVNKPMTLNPPRVSLINSSRRQSNGNYNRLLKMEDELGIVANYEEFECPVCFIPIATREGVVLRNCLHSFCKDCISQSIVMSDPGEVKCPFMDDTYSCDELLQDREIRTLLTQEQYDGYLFKGLQVAESMATNAFHCQVPNCAGWIFYDPNVTLFQCPTCQTMNCVKCKALHNGTCEQYQQEQQKKVHDVETAQAFEAMIKNGTGMNCPVCNAFIVRTDGCDFVQCAICKLGICWVTKQRRWGPAGHGDISMGCKCSVIKKCHPNCRNCH